MATISQKTLCYDFVVNYRDGSGVLQTAYFSTVDRAGATGDPTYTGFIEGRVTQMQLAESVWREGGTRGPREPWTGHVDLENGDGALDDWTTKNVHKCAFVIRQINLETLAIVGSFQGICQVVEVDKERVRIYIRDQAHYLQSPALTSVYAGTNALPAGIEGTAADIGGTRKPWILGTVYRFAPVCVNTSRLIYQVDGTWGFQTGWSMTVKDMGVTLTAGANYVSQADMEANIPAAGQYRVWPAGGCFRLQAKPTGQLTCDPVNPVPTAVSCTPVAVTGLEVHAIVAKILSVAISGATVTASALTARPAMGIAITGDMTYLDAINELTQGVGGWTLNGGAMVVSPSLDPSAQSSSRDYAESAMVDFQKSTVTDEERGMPVWKVTLRYQRNYTPVNSDDQLAGAVSAADVAFARQEWRSVVSSDTAVQTTYPNAPEIVVYSLMSSSSEAQTECARLLALYKVRRETYTVEVGAQRATAELSIPSYATITHSRFGLSAGKKMQLIGRTLNTARGTVNMTFWG